MMLLAVGEQEDVESPYPNDPSGDFQGLNVVLLSYTARPSGLGLVCIISSHFSMSISPVISPSEVRET